MLHWIRMLSSFTGVKFQITERIPACLLVSIWIPMRDSIISKRKNSQNWILMRDYKKRTSKSSFLIWMPTHDRSATLIESCCLIRFVFGTHSCGEFEKCKTPRTIWEISELTRHMCHKHATNAFKLFHKIRNRKFTQR